SWACWHLNLLCYSPLPAASRLTGTDPLRSLRPRGFSNKALDFSTEDYDRLEDTVTSSLPNRVSTYGGTPQHCVYNPCLENQIPCAEQAAYSGCLCPGFTLHNKAPQAPDLKSVFWNGSEVVIQWCAPYSYVKTYIVTKDGQNSQKFEKDKRSATVGTIDHITEVCVFAENDSGTSNGSCMTYHPRDNSLALKAGLIGGALGFLLLLLLAVLLWRHRRQRKQEASISMHDTAETR
uniref:Uncharacterized protein n=1 Tax=Mastacembelus armatus TaxID=205130 RepID=A0A3Q3MCR8_9TELE